MLKGSNLLTFISHICWFFSGRLSTRAAPRGMCRVPQSLSGAGKTNHFTLISNVISGIQAVKIIFLSGCSEFCLSE